MFLNDYPTFIVVNSIPAYVTVNLTYWVWKSCREIAVGGERDAA